MADNKIVSNPPFTEDTELDTTQVDEVEEGETKVAPEEGGEGTEAPTEPQEKPKEEKEKEALERDLGNIQGDISQLELKKQQVLEARKQRRALREEVKTLQPEEAIQDDLSDIDQEDINRLEKVLKSKGYVSRTEVQETLLKQAQQEVEDSFFTSHPEYSVSSDSNDLLYNALKEEIVQFAKPQSAIGMKRVLERAHKAVQERYPSAFPQKGSLSAEMAKQHRKEVATLGGGVTSSGTSRQSTLTEIQKDELRRGGFTEAEIADM